MHENVVGMADKKEAKSLTGPSGPLWDLLLVLRLMNLEIFNLVSVNHNQTVVID
jgi:hypothetical protein